MPCKGSELESCPTIADTGNLLLQSVYCVHDIQGEFMRLTAAVELGARFRHGYLQKQKTREYRNHLHRTSPAKIWGSIDREKTEV